jgi:hypothetical protein
MECVELLTVEDCFEICGLGIVVVPDFSVPHCWKDQTATLTILHPDGQHLEATAHLNMAHFNFRDAKVPSISVGES